MTAPELSPVEAATVARFGLDRPENAHSIVWRFDRDHVEAVAVCEDDDCLSRYACTEPCEVVYDVRREPDGSVTHKPWEDEFPAINRHLMVKQDYCNLLEFLNADPYLLLELNDGGQTFEIGRTPIEPVWQGEDGALWRRRD